jgi:hypothetical protein
MNQPRSRRAQVAIVIAEGELAISVAAQASALCSRRNTENHLIHGAWTPVFSSLT